MIKYLERNKEWIFSGCGVALIIVLGPFLLRLFHHQDSASIASPTPAVSSTTTQTSFSPVSFAEVVKVSNDTNLTQLQKDEFRRKYQGKLVEWTAKVRSVSRLWETQADSDFVVVFTPEQKENDRLAFDDYATATFPSNLRDEMIDLYAGDTIRFRGTIEFSGIEKIPSIRNCQLLEHTP